MDFDDIVRVANLKCRASRFARVRREVGSRDGDIVHIVDYFKPGIPEFAALLPERWAQRLLRWDRRRQTRGKAPFAIALHVRADRITGFAALRMLASLKGWRRRGFRYAVEQALIERWLDAILHSADWQVANEITLCGRLIKGHGATNERGKHNMGHIIEHLATGGSLADAGARAAAIRSAREAVLADDAGRAPDQALVQHGAPARPVVAQPIRWTRKPARDPVRPAA
jgi:indolepyruvate ferredoxin oxidoreductase beta subunit